MRKFPIIFMAALFLLSSSAATLRANEIAPFENEITNPITIAGHTFVPHVLQRGPLTQVIYSPYTDLVYTLANDSYEHHWSDEKLRRKLCNLNFQFSYGQFYVYTFGKTPESFTKNRFYTTLIQNQNPLEKRGAYGKPSKPSGGGVWQGLWWSAAILGGYLTDLDLNRSFEIWVVDNSTHKTTKYLYEAVAQKPTPDDDSGLEEDLYQLAFYLRQKFRTGFIRFMDFWKELSGETRDPSDYLGFETL
ncbi:hypothetical protein LWC08_05315 [Desulfobaculum bizertense]|uniref:hypothetical protein n=1 Tax=Desulfobaculum bizertense TaxID=376490 RepID=UPI001F188CE6|nr:hypothetical protein [Desulfobaculum bizertense]UIJ38995.1 hypothetical protein LWC08_05315 [Desulfobaculum bizertense]